jgi:hypothetical protein
VFAKRILKVFKENQEKDAVRIRQKKEARGEVLLTESSDGRGDMP